MSRIAEIAAALAGYDPKALSVEGVQQFVEQLVAPGVPAMQRQREDVPLREALGRVLAEDVVSPFSVPQHDNSAMDGFAFDGSALDGATGDLYLHIVGTALAGTAWRGEVGPG